MVCRKYHPIRSSTHTRNLLYTLVTIMILLAAGVTASFARKMVRNDFIQQETRIQQTNLQDKLLFTDSTSTEAQFPGGSRAWMMHLMQTLRYPEEAQKARIEGTVLVRFLVNEKGKINNLTASGPATGGLKEEAIRIIRQGGKWKPATVNGKPVDSYKEQVITFKLKE